MADISLDATHDSSWARATQYANQELSVGGRLTVNADRVSLDAASASAGEVAGSVGALEVASRQDESTAGSRSVTVGASVVIVAGVPIPYPSKFEYAQGMAKDVYVKRASSIFSKKGISGTDFKV